MNERFSSLRILCVVAFSLVSAHLLSFLFEGRILYGLFGYYGLKPGAYVGGAIAAHLCSLLCCGFFVRSPRAAKRAVLWGIFVCMAAAAPFFFGFPSLGLFGLLPAGVASGCVVACWGCFLRLYAPRTERVAACADLLILSNLLMAVINAVAAHISPFVGLALSTLGLAAGGFLLTRLPAAPLSFGCDAVLRVGGLRKPLLVLCLFIMAFTVNSGLMYQVINPAFAHLDSLTSCTWAIPYIVAVALLRGSPRGAKQDSVLYAGMAMTVAAFICFMLLGRESRDYFVVNSLLLGACGIFDLFWWGALGEMAAYAPNPVRLFGVGLAANVLGVFCGGALGAAVSASALSGAEVAVIALTLVCTALALLPPLERNLSALLDESGGVLSAEEAAAGREQAFARCGAAPIELLTARERDVLRLLLEGQSNREISGNLCITENTVKSHLSSIYSKCGVKSRAEMISSFFRP